MRHMHFVRPWTLCICLLAAGAGTAAARTRSYAAYKGAIVIDAASGRVLFQDNADAESPPASMTKLMTFAVLEDAIRAGRLTLQTPVTVTADDARVGMLRDSTSVWLKKGEVFPVEELIYAMMIQSANDAAYTVAGEVAGSVPAFVEAMNAKARELGMDHTTFRTPNGLPVRSHRIADGDLTTPRDYAILCRYLVNHTDILHYTSVKARTFGSGRRFPPTQMVNHNHLLGRIAGVDGLKTGFTNGAGFCLSATARRGNRRVIVVMMDSPDAKSRDLKVAELIDRGFTADAFEGQISSPNRPERPAEAPAAPSSEGGAPIIRFVVPQ